MAARRPFSDFTKMSKNTSLLDRPLKTVYEYLKHHFGGPKTFWKNSHQLVEHDPDGQFQTRVLCRKRDHETCMLHMISDNQPNGLLLLELVRF